jgi:drug/metabolite transporter (DMT)-like permease
MTTKFKAELSLLFITLLWGAGFPLTSIALKDIGPYTFISIRSIIAVVVLIILFHKKLKLVNKTILKIAFLISISMFIGSALQNTGLVYTTPSKSGFLTGLNVIFVPIILGVFYNKVPERKTIIGVILSVAGLFAMSLKGMNGQGGLNIGDILTILCAVAFSMQIILVDKFAAKVDAILITILELAFIGVLSFFPALAIEQFNITLNTGVIVALLFTAVFCTAIGMMVMNKMQPETDPTHASIIYLGEPVFAAFFSAFIGDRLSGGALLGCLLILVGMIVTSFKISSTKL